MPTVMVVDDDTLTGNRSADTGGPKGKAIWGKGLSFTLSEVRTLKCFTIKRRKRDV